MEKFVVRKFFKIWPWLRRSFIFRRPKKNLVIMGSHSRTVSLFDWTREDCEIWLFNEAPRAKDEKALEIHEFSP